MIRLTREAATTDDLQSVAEQQHRNNLITGGPMQQSEPTYLPPASLRFRRR